MKNETHEAILGGIDRMTLLAISGGRVKLVDDVTVELPVAHGYSVSIRLDVGLDLFEVRRLFKRGGKVFEKGLAERVYIEDLSEIAYDASCYHHDFGSVYARS